VTGVTDQGTVPQGGYRPGLDGIRAIAVALVLAFHLDRLDGGNLGVDVFFVVSGWLITWKLLGEHEQHGRIRLRHFWSGRARRLMPASLAVLVTIAVVWPLAGIDVPSLRRDLLFAAGWVSNWGTISSGGDYWARFGEPSPVTHFWSLAIEEQFYLVWPLVLVALLSVRRRSDPALSGTARTVALLRSRRRRRHAVGWTCLGLAAASVVAMIAMYDPLDPTATYMNTFARAHSLLLGAAAAAGTTVHYDGGLAGGRLARRLAPGGAAIAAAILLTSSSGADWMFRWGFPLFSASVVALVVAAADGAGARVLASRPMRWVADRSYGLYLWHWPVFLLLTPARLGVGDGTVARLALDVARVAVAVVLADRSFRWLESPVRLRHRLVAWRGPFAAAAAMSVITVLSVTFVPASSATTGDAAIVTLPPPPTGPATASTLPLVTAAPDDSVASMAVPPGTAPAATAPASNDTTDTTDSTDTTVATAAADPSAAPTTSTTLSPPLPQQSLGRALRVLVTGDSTALHLGQALLPFAASVPDQLVAGSAAFPGCGLSAADDGRLHAFTNVDRSRELIDLSGCVGQFRQLPGRIVTEAVDVIVVKIGPWDAVDIHLTDGRVVSVGDPVGQELVRQAYLDFAARITSAGALLVWVTPDDTHVGWGEFDDPVNEPARWDALRQIIDELTMKFDVLQVDEQAWLEASGLTGPEGRPDGVHLAEGLNERFVIERLAPALAEAAARIGADR
jgi:peptidoglycan/LPS O-acetylase OafA/YrhL